MSNSSLVDYVKISPHKTSPRNKPIKKITIHHMAGNLSVETCGNVFQTREASSNYGIGSDGRIGMYVAEKDRSWASSSPDNDNQAVTIEVANNKLAPDWTVSEKAMTSLINLCVDICKRNGIKKLNYTGDKTGNLTMHKWFAATACPGPYLEKKFPYIANEVNKRLGSSSTTTSTTTTKKNEIPASLPFKVQVLIDNLNIRSTGSMSGKVEGKTGKGVFTIVSTNSNGWGKLKSGEGWIYLRNPEYCKILKSVESEATSLPYKVEITIDDLNIRTSPSAKNSSNKLGKYTGKGVFTIIDEATGPINSLGKTGKWGLLKSYSKNRNGWICLDVSGVDKL